MIQIMILMNSVNVLPSYISVVPITKMSQFSFTPAHDPDYFMLGNTYLLQIFYIIERQANDRQGIIYKH